MSKKSLMRVFCCCGALTVLLLGSCRVEPSEPGPPFVAPVDVGQESDVSAQPDLSMGLNPTAGEVAALCLAACEARSVDGDCVPPTGICDTLCFDAILGAPDYSTETFACLHDASLCDQSLAQCVWARVFPDPTAHTVTLRGTGYGEWVGVAPIAAIEVASGVFVYGSSVVDDAGEFELGIEVTMDVLAPHLVLFWLDRNADGVCEPDLEPTGSGTYELASPTAPLVVPDWVIEVNRIEVSDAPFVCDFI